MFDRIRQAFRGIDSLSVDRDGNQIDNDLRLATAVIVLGVAQADGAYSAEEGKTIFKSLEKEFALTPDSIHRLLAVAEQNVGGRERMADFISTINEHFDDVQKQRIMAMVWRVISADGFTSERESQLAVELRERLNLTMEQALRARRLAEEGVDLTKEEIEPLRPGEE
jgi:uncharacterized tellurite resistance protein B-like protein